ncbi:MAG: hypothetical protein MO853_00325 [Candidatus Protistobacter heckmanni]|nr:hypothetical protein [Candidatus Protistobacter heckmanni]
MFKQLGGVLSRFSLAAPTPAIVRIYRSRNATTMVGSIADICRMLDERCKAAA